MGAELTVKVDNPRPTNDGVFVVNDGEGSLTDDIYSFLIVAWYNGSDESDIDYAGWIKTVHADWEDWTTSGGDDSISMTWDAPTDATGEIRYPSHYSIYFQLASSFNLANQATKIAEVDCNTTSYTFDTDVADPTYKTFATTDTNFTLNPILDISIQVRMQTVRTFDGRLAKKSYAYVNPVDWLDIRIVGMSMTNANYKKLMNYTLYSIPLRITESLPGGAENNPFVQHWYGRMIDMPDYIGSKNKNAKDSFLLRFRVETAAVA